MKITKKNIGFLFGVLLLLQACSKQNNPEPLDFKALNPIVHSEEYYANLRAYKKSDHAVAFGWWGFSGSTVLKADMTYRYEALPDSMDIISLWGGIPYGDAFEEMQSVRKKKGTKFVMVAFGGAVERRMKSSFPELSKTDIMAAIDSVAKSISDEIDSRQIDGFDLDYEPDYGDPSMFGDDRGRGRSGYTSDDPHTQRLFKALSKYMGPKSGTDKILIIDGQFDIGIEPYINYLVQQAYNSSGPGALQQRYDGFGGSGILPSKKFIVTENMQDHGGFGARYIYNGVDIGSVTGMAMWNPTQGRKGGFGGFIIDSDYGSRPANTYYYIRRGIQIQNPAPK
jgi:hypothetical protein